jgi:hypothetical protein
MPRRTFFADMDRFPSRGPDPLTRLLQTEKTPENLERVRRRRESDERAARYQPEIAPLIPPRVQSTSYRDRGCLAIHWRVTCRYETASIAERFGQTNNAIKVARHRAMKWALNQTNGLRKDAVTLASKRGELVWRQIELEIARTWTPKGGHS